MLNNISIEELIQWQQQGTLESHILSNGWNPLNVLDIALKLAADTIQELEEESDRLVRLVKMVDELAEELGY